MNPITWMKTVYFQRYLKLDILARLCVGYLMWSPLPNFNTIILLMNKGVIYCIITINEVGNAHAATLHI